MGEEEKFEEMEEHAFEVGEEAEIKGEKKNYSKNLWKNINSFPKKKKWQRKEGRRSYS